MLYWHGEAPGPSVGTHSEALSKRSKTLRPEQCLREAISAKLNYSKMRDPKLVYFSLHGGTKGAGVGVVSSGRR